MERQFWIDKWNRQETGFHQSAVNPWLEKFWPALEAGAGGEVLVPLCGKSGDMLWLRQSGHSVLGVELSELAIESFFRDNGLEAEKSWQGKFSASAAENIRLLCGDSFALSADDVKNVRAVYDRAALIALPPDMRKRYAGHLKSILPAGCKMLLVTLDYPQEQMDGPPFAVGAGEVETLYGADNVTLLSSADALENNPRFQERGLDYFHEMAFAVKL
ncbi:MAG: thiopurine S-methyltransferase [Alphaproteobacteria bacterium]|nr:thiopurine S-methyltransferase [Alphaproteobacteria bacterium]